MATQILAIDDSATMQKILEITFAGTDYQLTIVGSGDEGVARASGGGFALAICDNSLDPSGYDVAARIKQAGVPVLFLSSRQNPYDASQGAGAGVDDHIDKPFDTQQLIDRVTKLLGGAPATAGAPAPAAAAPAPAPAPAPAAARPAAGFGAQAPRGVAPAPAAAPKVSGFGAQPARAAAPAPAPAARTPAPAAVAAAPAARPAAAAAAVSSAVDAHLGAKLGEMGLSPQQADAIAALSRDLVEKVVWEVVPVLAETLIREEIARLTK